MGKDFDRDRLDALVALLAPVRRTRVVEVGANPINDNPYAGLLAAGHCEVWGFEPEPRAFARLAQSATETYLPYAIGTGGPATLHVTKAASLTSLLRPDAQTAAFFQRFASPGTVIEEITVETHRLDELDDVPPFDLMKIDVQGGELQVFEGAAAKLATALAVITEVGFVPLYEDQPLIDDQMRVLRGHGFDLHKFSFLKGFSLRGGLATRLEKTAHDNQLLDGDAVFLRCLRHPDLIDTEALKHMAILCDAVIESFDVAARCLDLLIARDAIDAGAAAAYVARLPRQGKPMKLAAQA
ncbi:FkbM family methyltransferase [Roseicyclus mahoneyensis]|uniref:FkbM family methyltransferase n=1 Tax=Roseicyclus mahoneyensis TaxID=164332 RepID=A0A316GNW2_9RHOB|nr:FkbM family methyltransferase [Roseicyclus mahoneyensis]PWK62469.1 FkbM family methyltransferase [Roseicyclus mahoneyensis]